MLILYQGEGVDVPVAVPVPVARPKSMTLLDRIIEEEAKPFVEFVSGLFNLNEEPKPNFGSSTKFWATVDHTDNQ